MEMMGPNGITESGFLMLWFGSGLLSWILFVIFVGYVIGYQEFKKPMMKRVGGMTLILMSAMGLLSATISLTAFIPFIEKVLEPEMKGENGD